MKDSYYFSHDYNARNDERILELRSEYGVEGYGVFWMLIESMAESSDGKLNRGAIGGLSLGYGLPKERLLAIVDFCIQLGLFVLDEEGKFYSQRMMEHRELRAKFKEKGREGALKMWSERKKDSPPISPPNGEGNAKERKGKEIKEKDIPPNPLQGESAGTDSEKQGKAKTDTFVPPTVDEVKAFFVEKTGVNGLASEKFAEKFINHYTQKKWKYGGTKISNWKLAACSSWDMDEYVTKYHKPNSPPSAQPQIKFNAFKND